MALTMTRTRTQTTLNRLSRLVANVHGELAIIDRLMSAKSDPDINIEALVRRKRQREEDRDALYATLKQFDPALDPLSIGLSYDWMSVYGRRSSPSSRKSYLRAIESSA